MHLIAPEQFVALAVLESIPGVQELCDAMVSNVIRILLGLFPGERSA